MGQLRSAEPGALELYALAAGPGPQARDYTTQVKAGTPAKTLWLEKTPLLDGTAVLEAKISMDSGNNGYAVNVVLTEAGAKRFAEITAQSVGQRIAIVLDGHLILAPTINQAIRGGSLQLVGDNWAEQEAKAVTDRLNGQAKAK